MLLASRELDQLGDQRRHLAELLDDVAQQSLALSGGKRAVAREHLDVRPQARERRSQLVRRVGDELALRPRRLFERAEHGVEARGEPAELVAPLRVDPLGQIAGLRHLLGRVGQPSHRRQRGSRDGQPKAGGDPDSADRDQDQEQPHPVERAVDLGQRAGDLHGRVPHVREGEHAEVRAPGVQVGEERVALALSDRDGRVAHRQLDRLPGGRAELPSARTTWKYPAAPPGSGSIGLKGL